MVKAKNVMTILRRDASLLWHAAIAALFIAFVGLAIVSALLDLWALRR